MYATFSAASRIDVGILYGLYTATRYRIDLPEGVKADDYAEWTHDQAQQLPVPDDVNDNYGTPLPADVWVITLHTHPGEKCRRGYKTYVTGSPIYFYFTNPASQKEQVPA
jgi:hypothetical protein